MTYVVGTVSMDVAGNLGPVGALHAIRLEEAYTGVTADAGQRLWARNRRTSSVCLR